MQVAERQTRASMRAAKSRPILIELGGIAGSGKTTLANALQRADDRIALSPAVSSVAKLRALGPCLASIFRMRMSTSSPDRFFSWKEFRAMVRLRAWSAAAERNDRPAQLIVLFDHGPLFWLIRLQEFGPSMTGTPEFRSWWDRAFAFWRNRLDLLIWLDAPDSTLIRRIQQRGTEHRMLGKSDHECLAFLARYRAAYNALKRDDINTLHFRTERDSAESIARSIVSLINPENLV